MSVAVPPRFGRTRWLTTGVLIGAAGWTAPAAAQGRLSLDAGVSAGVATNPFQQPGDTPVAASGTLELTPEYVIDSEFTRLRIAGDARITGYTSDYPLNDSYTLRAGGSHRVSPRVRLNGEAAYVNSVVGAFGGIFAPIPVIDPVIETGTGTVPETTPPQTSQPPVGTIGVGTGGLTGELPNLAIDPALSGIGQRREAFSVVGGATVVLGRFDQLAARATAVTNRYPDGIGVDEFDSAGAGVSYQRTLSEGFSVGVNADVSRVNYTRGRLGDSTIYQPSVTVTRAIDQRWSLSATAGAAFVQQQGLAGEQTSTSFNGSLNACRRDVRWNACLTATRATVPSAIQGVRTQTGVSASGSYRVSPTDSLSVLASYSRAGAPLLDTITPGGTPGGTPIANVGAVTFTSVGATYSRRLAPRVSAFATAGGAWSDDGFVNRDPNIEGRVGIRFRLEGRR